MIIYQQLNSHKIFNVLISKLISHNFIIVIIKVINNMEKDLKDSL